MSTLPRIPPNVGTKALCNAMTQVFPVQVPNNGLNTVITVKFQKCQPLWAVAFRAIALRPSLPKYCRCRCLLASRDSLYNAGLGTRHPRALYVKAE